MKQDRRLVVPLVLVLPWIWFWRWIHAYNMFDTESVELNVSIYSVLSKCQFGLGSWLSSVDFVWLR